MNRRTYSDYRAYTNETTVIEAFEAWEDAVECDLGDLGEHWGDFGDWFLCFRAGFTAGGDN